MSDDNDHTQHDALDDLVRDIAVSHGYTFAAPQRWPDHAPNSSAAAASASLDQAWDNAVTPAASTPAAPPKRQRKTPVAEVFAPAAVKPAEPPVGRYRAELPDGPLSAPPRAIFKKMLSKP